MGNKPFSCHLEGCTKQYARMEDLRTHMKTHYSAGDPNFTPEHSSDKTGDGLDFKLTNPDRDSNSGDGRSVVSTGNGVDMMVDGNASHSATTSFTLPANITVSFVSFLIFSYFY